MSRHQKAKDVAYHTMRFRIPCVCNTHLVCIKRHHVLNVSPSQKKSLFDTVAHCIKCSEITMNHQVCNITFYNSGTLYLMRKLSITFLYFIFVLFLYFFILFFILFLYFFLYFSILFFNENLVCFSNKKPQKNCLLVLGLLVIEQSLKTHFLVT